MWCSYLSFNYKSKIKYKYIYAFMYTYIEKCAIFSSKTWKRGCVYKVKATALKIFNLLSEENFTSSTDALAGLSRALVGTSLKSDQPLSSPQLFLRKVTFALL